MSAPVYTPQYVRTLQTVFGYDKEFEGALAELQIVDGIRHNATAFTVKTNDTPVVVGTYNTDENVAFGTGTANSNRFGERTEIIYTDTDVPYTYDLAIHEGIDVATVNNDFDEALMDRMILQSEANVLEMNVRNGKALSDNAGETVELAAAFGEDEVIEVFNDMAVHFKNNRVRVRKYAYVRPDVYNIIVDSGLATTGKNSSVNIDDNEILKFKDFFVINTPEDNFEEGDVAYFAAEGVLVPFVGVEIYRAIESEAFAGVALQSYAKGGTFVLEDNKKAIVKVVLL